MRLLPVLLPVLLLTSQLSLAYMVEGDNKNGGFNF